MSICLQSSNCACLHRTAEFINSYAVISDFLFSILEASSLSSSPFVAAEQPTFSLPFYCSYLLGRAPRFAIVRSLLDLPDEALCLIFRALDTHVLRGLRASHKSSYPPTHPFIPNILCSPNLCSPDPPIPYERAIPLVFPATNGTSTSSPLLAGRALASSCIRLNDIYRSTVDELVLVNSYSEKECDRLWTRYPCITTLDFCLRYVPGSIRDDVSPQERVPGPASHFLSLLARSNAQPPLSPCAYPIFVMRSNVKNLTIRGARMQLCELRAIIESCAALESVRIYESWLFLEEEPRDYAENLCSVALESMLLRCAIYRSGTVK